eukprot:TRINITY_DN2316_c0_g1_i1.p1 TRINITY_DN2316_c0_g1~~TRINITY_DN2316_c0_g1_i1.p1  ORF type:complete len:779 (-),score=258.81 TRINITY_DN2316_c0_g1_i1:448-2637(-)
MADGSPLSPHVAARLQMNYASALDLLRSNATPDKKKNASKVTAALKTMLHYDIDPSLLPALVFYLSYEKVSSVGNVTRLVFYLLNHCKEERLQESDFPSAFSALDTLLGKKGSVPLRVEAVKTFSLVLPETFSAKAKVDEVCVNGLRVDGGKDKKKAKENANKVWHQYASLYAYRHREVTDESTLHLICEGVTSEDPVAARHAFAILCKYVKLQFRAFICTNALQYLISGVGGTRANLEDELARVFMVRLLADIGTAPDADTSVSNKDAFYSILCQRVMDQSNRVSYEAIQALARGSWAKLASATFATYADKDADANHLVKLSDKSVLKAIITRLCVAFSHSNTAIPFMHATMRTAHAVCVSHICHQALASDMSNPGEFLPPVVRDKSDLGVVPTPALSQPSSHVPNSHLVRELRKMSSAPEHVLMPMFRVLEEYVAERVAPAQLRLYALKCLVWLAFGDGLILSQRIIERELRASSLSGAQFATLFLEMLERSEVTPSCTPMVLHLVRVWREVSPEEVCHHTIGRLWESLASKGPLGRHLVLKNIFECLDIGSRAQKHAHDVKFLRYAYAHLGAHGVMLASGEKTKESAEGGEDTIAAALEAVLVRLQNAAVFSEWETRNVAVEALAQIGICSPSIGVRTHILEVCKALPAESCTRSRSDALLHVVKRLMEASERWAGRLEECGGTLEDYQLELMSEEKMLRSLTEIFGGWSSSESCIGPQFTRFLAS